MGSAYYYDGFPETCDPNDLWGQVKRTVNGRPVGQDQIDMLVAAVSASLELSPEDTLLDLCCGNGALSVLLFARCAAGFGVDFSEYLIQIAKERFESDSRRFLLVQDVAEYVHEEPKPERFTKAVCYGSFQYLTPGGAVRTLTGLRGRFSRLQSLFVGNIPDRERAGAFYPAGTALEEVVGDHRTPIGIWRSREEFSLLAAEAGWDAAFSAMPETYYAASYRYDALLTPRND